MIITIKYWEFYPLATRLADRVNEKLRGWNTWCPLFSLLTLLSIRKKKKKTPQRHTNGSVLAGVVSCYVCMSVFVFVHLCSDCIAYACSCIRPNMSVCLYQQELRFCRIWMKVWVMAPVSILSFLPSGLHLSLSSPHVGTYVDVTATLLGLQYAYHMIHVHGWASLLPYHKRLYLQQWVFKKVIHFKKWLFVYNKDNHYSIPDKCHTRSIPTGC